MTHVELALANLEPAPPSPAPVIGGSAAYPRRIVLTPEEIAATDTAARSPANLAAQRRGRVFEEARRRAAGAGITLDGCAMIYNESFTDEEIDATFRHVKALGVTTVISPLTLASARRLVPFAERHGVRIAIHNQTDGNTAGLVDTAQLPAALALSTLYRVRLDVGHLHRVEPRCGAICASTCRARPRSSARIACATAARASHWARGRPPLAGVLNVLAAVRPAVPALLEVPEADAGLRGWIRRSETVAGLPVGSAAAQLIRRRGAERQQ